MRIELNDSGSLGRSKKLKMSFTVPLLLMRGVKTDRGFSPVSAPRALC
jgi:hypothetical protein